MEPATAMRTTSFSSVVIFGGPVICRGVVSSL